MIKNRLISTIACIIMSFGIIMTTGCGAAQETANAPSPAPDVQADVKQEEEKTTTAPEPGDEIESSVTDTEEETDLDISDEGTGTAVSKGEYMGYKLTEGIDIPTIETKKYMLPDSEGVAFADNLKVGFDLGNTFDAYDDDGFKDEMAIEECWQGVHTTPELIKKIHELGFTSIRIPVSWHNHVSDDLTISEQWLDRVEEVVDYALDEDMYVIINIHHDNHPEANGYYPDMAHMDQSKRYVERIWSQVGERFKDRDEHLIFESLNEPRLVGTSVEWNFSNANKNCQESQQCINELNALFVNTIRAQGGNNATRYLMCPGYCAAPDGAMNPWFELPEDPSGLKNHIIVSIHAYTPYNFALEYPGTKSFDLNAEGSTSDIDQLMSKLYMTFILEGTPVVIGEFGARNKGGNLQDRVDYAAYYTAKARDRGIPVVWWDNNEFNGSGENFGIINRKDVDKSTFEIIAAMMQYQD